MTSKNLLSLYYYAYSPSSRAVLAVANTLGLKPNIVRVNPHKGEHHKEDFRKVREETCFDSTNCLTLTGQSR